MFWISFHLSLNECTNTITIFLSLNTKYILLYTFTMSSSVYSRMSNSRMSQVHGWEKICETLYGGKNKLPWDESERVSAVRRKLDDDADDEGSYSLTWDSSSDGEDSHYDDDDDESFTDDDFSVVEEVSFAQESANGSNSRLSFLHTLRQAASYSPAAGPIPDDIALPGNNSTSGLSYVSRLSMQSDLQAMSDRGQRMMENLEEMAVTFPGNDTVTDVVPHPKETLEDLLEGTKYNENTLTAEYWDEFFLPSTAERVERFNSRAARLVAKGSLKAFQDFHQRTELSLDACNNRGETLLHLACRANARTIVQYLLRQGASLHVRDKVGRSPLVELCWTKQPDLPLIDLVLQKAPALLFVVDRRGFAPLQYVPRGGHSQWNSYLVDQLKPKLLMFAQYAVYAQTARELQNNQARLQKLLLERLSS
jgi:Ankyrin repeats (many copies)